MIIDCDSCAVREVACGDCVIGVLLGVPAVPAAGERRTGAGAAVRRATSLSATDHLPSGASTVHLDAPERRALDVLADQGLVPRLRLVAGPVRRDAPNYDSPESDRHAG